MTFSGYLNVYNLWRVLFAARKADCSFMDTFEEKTFLSLEMQRHGLIIWGKPN